MDCSGIGDHLSPLLDGELEAEKAETVRAHLAKCPHCRKSFRDHMRVKQFLSHKLLFKEAPPGLRAAILDTLHSPQPSGLFHLLGGRLRAKPLMASGLAVTVLIMLSVLVLLLPGSHSLPPVLSELLDRYGEASQPSLEVVSADVAYVGKKVSESLKKEIGVADLKNTWGFLLGARKCPVCRRNAVEVRYLHPAGDVSSFMVLNAGKRTISNLCTSGKLQERRIDGERYLYCECECGKVILWWEGGDIFVVRSCRCFPSASLARMSREIRAGYHQARQ